MAEFYSLSGRCVIFIMVLVGIGTDVGHARMVNGVIISDYLFDFYLYLPSKPVSGKSEYS